MTMHGYDNVTSEWSDWLSKENNRFTRAARFLVQFFDVVYQTTTWNLHIWGFSNRARRSKLFILCLYVETIRAQQATLSLSCTK